MLSSVIENDSEKSDTVGSKDASKKNSQILKSTIEIKEIIPKTSYKEHIKASIINRKDHTEDSLAIVSKKHQDNVEIKLDLDALNRVDEVYFAYLQQTKYYQSAQEIKQNDKLIAFQIIFRCALLKKLLMTTKVKKKRLIVQHFDDLRSSNFEIPATLNPVINSYGRFSHKQHHIRIHNEIYTINTLTADIARLCANHSTLNKRINEKEVEYFKSLRMEKIHFLDYHSNMVLRNQASSLLQTLYEKDIVFSLSEGKFNKNVPTSFSEDNIILKYPQLKLNLVSSMQLSSYRTWLKMLSPHYPDYKVLVLAGAATICRHRWFSLEHANKPFHDLVPDIETKGFVFTPQDILDVFGWKAVPNSAETSFQQPIKYALELCKSHPFKSILNTQKTSFTEAGNIAQLVCYNINQKEARSSLNNSLVYCDLVPNAVSEMMMLSLGDKQAVNIGHLFGLTKELKCVLDIQGKLKYDIQEARAKFLSKDFLSESVNL